MALIYYLSTISTWFADIMTTSNIAGKPMRIIIYIDEICPGNPLRPDKSRTLQAIYWAFADWPQWLLQRTAAWPCFGTMRSKLAKLLPGGEAGLLKMVLDTFWPATGQSFHSGVTVVCKSVSLVITATFGGFLADEKAHNQITGSKGASGNHMLYDNTFTYNFCLNIYF